MDTVRNIVVIAEVDPADQCAVEGAYRVLQRAGAHDVPDFPPACRYRFGMQLKVPWPGQRTVRWIARCRKSDDVVGYLHIDLPTIDNLSNASIELVGSSRASSSRHRTGAI